MINSLKKLEFNIGGYGSSNFWFELKNSKITYNASLYPMKMFEGFTRIVDNSEIEKFIETLNAIKISQWNDNYFDNDILDGIQWEVTINYNNTIEKNIFGSNEFPTNKLKNKSVFELFKISVRNLIKEPLFFNDSFIDKIEKEQ